MDSDGSAAMARQSSSDTSRSAPGMVKRTGWRIGGSGNSANSLHEAEAAHMALSGRYAAYGMALRTPPISIPGGSGGIGISQPEMAMQARASKTPRVRIELSTLDQS